MVAFSAFIYGILSPFIIILSSSVLRSQAALKLKTWALVIAWVMGRPIQSCAKNLEEVSDNTSANKEDPTVSSAADIKTSGHVTPGAADDVKYEAATNEIFILSSSTLERDNSSGSIKITRTYSKVLK